VDAIDVDGEFTKAVLAKVAKYCAPQTAAQLLVPDSQVPSVTSRCLA
jgi:hypothetical protein